VSKQNVLEILEQLEDVKEPVLNQVTNLVRQNDLMERELERVQELNRKLIKEYRDVQDSVSQHSPQALLRSKISNASPVRKSGTKPITP
jgi:hypothetical protein